MRTCVRLVAMAGVLGALIALCAPIHLGSVDHSGAPVSCGSVLRTAGSSAQRTDAFNRDRQRIGGGRLVATDYTGECAQRLGDRRWIANIVVAAGLALLLGSIMSGLSRRAGRPRAEPGQPQWVLREPVGPGG